ncbi:hypothetical protein KCV87_05055 [Actinosynnema pretiosum subsp. pretiosum]|uniref:Uncharacterized protein n=1 Tax=Actinosynnema pretiosum subsp. pretiosum TaxID=103721 RepID=A0AA45L9X7_9PSEU|nr:hypothetical protein APASM_3014 [Actinosynnema pretiosum subsp. pretiosum]QUF05473.1 hypothetical protein KCV87_05055 [Actinosynnema pretiosum subsp. pretiosum]
MVVVKRVMVDADIPGCLRLPSREITGLLPRLLLSWPLPLLLGGVCSPP